MKGAFTGIYRGIVISNDLFLKTQQDYLKGRIKIFVPGIYPESYKENAKLLPWAQPAMSLFGGNWTNQSEFPTQLNKETGWCSIPHTGISPSDGAQVFLFFEAGDVNKPVYFASAQSGPGWLTEHVNQHVFKSDNVSICIDEAPLNSQSTCQFPPYIGKQSTLITEAFQKKYKDIFAMYSAINSTNSALNNLARIFNRNIEIRQIKNPF